MSVESEILRIQHNIANAYSAISEKGGEVPSQPTSENLPEAINTIPSGGGLIVGDGLSKEGDTLNVTNPNRGILTQAEYDALTPEQKASGTYFVGDGGGGGGGGESAGDVYSTEETRIGTWIDGKPLYRRVISFTGNASGNTNFDLTEWHIDTPARATGISHSTNSNTVPLPSQYAAFYFANNHQQLVYESIAVYRNANVIGIFEYTKTTDDPIVSTAEILAAYLDGLPAEDLNALAEFAANDENAGGGTE